MIVDNFLVHSPMQQGKQDRISSDKLTGRSVHAVTKYTKIHIRCDVLKSTKLQYLANLWLWRCQISQLLSYSTLRQGSSSSMILCITGLPCVGNFSLTKQILWKTNVSSELLKCAIKNYKCMSLTHYTMLWSSVLVTWLWILSIVYQPHHPSNCDIWLVPIGLRLQSLYSWWWV
jgi:hypothetical protein